MGVAGEQDERMLEDERGNPHIVGGDRSTLLPQLAVHSAIVMRGLFVGIKNSDAGFQEETAQSGLVARSLRADGKSRSQFSHDDERKPDFLGEFNQFDNRTIATTKIGIAVGIEGQSHDHISSSMVS